MIAAPDANRTFSVQRAELVVFNRDVRELLTDFEMLVDIVKVKGHTEQITVGYSLLCTKWQTLTSVQSFLLFIRN